MWDWTVGQSPTYQGSRWEMAILFVFRRIGIYAVYGLYEYNNPYYLNTPNYHSGHGFSEPGLVIYYSGLLDPSSNGGVRPHPVPSVTTTLYQ